MLSKQGPACGPGLKKMSSSRHGRYSRWLPHNLETVSRCRSCLQSPPKKSRTITPCHIVSGAPYDCLLLRFPILLRTALGLGSIRRQRRERHLGGGGETVRGWRSERWKGNYEIPMLSMSRIKQAICARLAASATRLRSRIKTSVLACFTSLVGGGGGAR